MKLSEILEVNFSKWYCTQCNLSWWLSKSFTSQKCPFRGHGYILRIENIMNFSAVPQSKVIELPEELTLEDYANIFKIGE